MPYEIQKHAKGYFVVNKITGKKYSKNPTTIAKAKAQMRILEKSSNDEIEGAGLADFLKKAYSKTKALATNISGRITGTIIGRDDYPPAERDIINNYGNNKIIAISIYKHQLETGVKKLVNVLSLGQFNKIKNKYSIDELYHLMMILTLDNNVNILLEKNEVINIHQGAKPKEGWEVMPLTIPSPYETTFKQFLDNTQNYMGNDYFKYDAFTNNCQRFIKSCILANPPLQQLNPNAINFIEQDVSGLNRDLSPTTKNIFSGITNLASRLNVLAKGRGFDSSNVEHSYKQE